MGEHEPLIIALFLPIVPRREWRGPWNVKGSKLASGTVRSLEREHRKDWEGLRPTTVGSNLQEVYEKTIRGCKDIVWKFMHKTMSFPSISNYVTQSIDGNSPFLNYSIVLLDNIY